MAYYYPATILAFDKVKKQWVKIVRESHDARKLVDDMRQSGNFSDISLNGVYYD